MWHAAVGTDGVRPVVWGIGETARLALQDAARYLDDGDTEALETHEITMAQVAVIQAGDVSWPVVEAIELPPAPSPGQQPARRVFSCGRCGAPDAMVAHDCTPATPADVVIEGEIE